MVGDGNNIPITHIGSISLKFHYSTFILNNVLCASIKKNLLFVSQSCSHNNNSINFFLDYFLMKDLTTRASLGQDQNKGNVYK